MKMAFRSSNPPISLSTILVLNSLILFFFIASVSSHNIACTPPSPPTNKCPKDILKFGVCGSWLGLVTEVIGTKPSPECCSLVKNIADIEAAMCLCTALKANVLGIVNMKLPIAVNLLLNGCGKKIPDGFKC